ncbi:ABC transporter substrate-binding protein [Paracoccus suum]|uniref:ABC transporter substrate-binding protein n=1 Tax=Paracoccus suum TaxID=2259340 RepID=A0A344PMB6_9RHOB|nr:ABC transporter substrate-binding protein [Paracoccus suum]AXC50521.1 ABC transporter substrate-binding protein [Paracoccus suum]
MKRSTLAGLTLSAALGLTAFGASAKDFVYCSEATPEGFDPALYSANSTWDASFEALYDALTRFKAGGTEVEPALAESWDVSPDGREYTFHLRPGVKFNGNDKFTPTREMNADDVIFSFTRQIPQDGPWKEYSQAGTWVIFDSNDMAKLIKEIIKVDDLTVKFVLSEANATFPALMARNFGAILSKEYADQLLADGRTDDLNLAPVGTGPFRLVNYQADAVIRYAANPDWWDGKPAIDNLIFAITPDPSVRMARLKADECQMAPFPAPADVAGLKADPALNVMEQPGLNVAYLAFNTQKAPFDDPALRKALITAIDRSALIETVYGGMGQVAETLVPPTMWGYASDIKPYPYDPEAAKKALAELGQKDLSVELWAIPISRSYMPNGRRAAEMIQSDLAAVGVKAEIVSYEWGEYLKRVRERDRDGIAMMGGSADLPDPNSLMNFFIGCESGGNAAFWCNEEVEGLMKEARQISDQGERTKLYVKIQNMIHDIAPVLPLANATVVLPMSAKVKNYAMDPLGSHRFEKLDLAD